MYVFLHSTYMLPFHHYEYSLLFRYSYHKIHKILLLAISIGVVTNQMRQITHVAQIGEIGAELKKLAKNVEKSNYVKDQRQKLP